MTSDQLLVYSQWYESSRQQGMGRRQSMNRALGIMKLGDTDADALIDGRTCDGNPARYVDVVCGKSNVSVPAFKIDDAFYCSYCGSRTSAR